MTQVNAEFYGNQVIVSSPCNPQLVETKCNFVLATIGEEKDNKEKQTAEISYYFFMVNSAENIKF